MKDDLLAGLLPLLAGLVALLVFALLVLGAIDFVDLVDGLRRALLP